MSWIHVPFLLLVLTSPAGVAAAELRQGPADRVEALVREADRLPLDRAWAYLERIEDLEIDEDALVQSLRKAGEQSRGAGLLIAARGLLDRDGRAAVDLLLKALARKDRGRLRRAAAALLGDPDLPTRAIRKARRVLGDMVGDDTLEPELRLAAATSLYKIAGDGTTRLRARRAMLAYLASRDRHLRILGALALAEIGDLMTGGARAVLEEIEGEPTREGRLAAAYLTIERRNRRIEQLYRELTELESRRQGTSGRRSAGDLALIREILTKIRLFHDDGRKVDPQYLLERAAKGMLKAMDRFSTFYTSDEYARFAFDLNRDYCGIGAFVNIDDQGNFKITRPIYSGPAYKAGLLSGDHIIKVDGWETTDKDINEIIRRLKGKPNTKVTVTVWRPGWPKPKDITLIRAPIQVPSVNSLLLPGGIAYVELVTFGAHTSEELTRHLTELRGQGAKACIIDLRNNGGGYLEQARRIDELFLPKGSLVVTTKGRAEGEEKLFTRRDPLFPDLPLVILVNEHTASASEIVAGSLQAHKRAVVVGVQTYGKGSVQKLFPVESMRGERFRDENGNGRWDEWEKFEDANGNGKYDPGPRARMTVARYYLPDGRCPDKRLDKDGRVLNKDYGVIPDVVVQADSLDMKDLWKNAVISELWQKGVFRKYVDEHLKGHEKLFLELAENDGRDAGRWPGFDEFFASLHTMLSKDDVRRWIRVAARERVSDIRGKAWPGGRLIGDWEEDHQLQAAIRIVLRKSGRKVDEVPAYRTVFGKAAAGKSEKVGSSR